VRIYKNLYHADAREDPYPATFAVATFFRFFALFLLFKVVFSSASPENGRVRPMLPFDNRLLQSVVSMSAHNIVKKTAKTIVLSIVENQSHQLAARCKNLLYLGKSTINNNGLAQSLSVFDEQQQEYANLKFVSRRREIPAIHRQSAVKLTPELRPCLFGVVVGVRLWLNGLA